MSKVKVRYKYSVQDVIEEVETESPDDVEENLLGRLRDAFPDATVEMEEFHMEDVNEQMPPARFHRIDSLELACLLVAVRFLQMALQRNPRLLEPPDDGGPGLFADILPGEYRPSLQDLDCVCESLNTRGTSEADLRRAVCLPVLNALCMTGQGTLDRNKDLTEDDFESLFKFLNEVYPEVFS